MAGVQLVAARDTVELLPNGRLRALRHYEYTIAGFGPFIYEVPRDEDTAEKLKQSIDADAAKLAAAQSA